MVGASSTALACLEGLVFNHQLNVTSLTLVSPEGLGAANAAGLSAGHEGTTTFNQEHREFGDEIRLSPTDEDAPEADRMVKMGLEGRARIIRYRCNGGVRRHPKKRIDKCTPYEVQSPALCSRSTVSKAAIAAHSASTLAPRHQRVKNALMPQTGFSSSTRCTEAWINPRNSAQ